MCTLLPVISVWLFMPFAFVYFLHFISTSVELVQVYLCHISYLLFIYFVYKTSFLRRYSFYKYSSVLHVFFLSFISIFPRLREARREMIFSSLLRCLFVFYKTYEIDTVPPNSFDNIYK